MAGIDPWTGARLGDMDDAMLGGFWLAKVVTDMRLATCPQFDTVSDRDAACNELQADGITLPDGMSCWTNDVGFWDRTGGVWVQRIPGIANAASKSYADGTSGPLSLIGGWAPYPGAHVPFWYLNSSGHVRLSGVVKRTAASFTLTAGTAFPFATLSAPIVPVSNVSPLCSVRLANGGTFPALLSVAAADTTLNIVGMDSGTGTMPQTDGFINLDNSGYHI